MPRAESLTRFGLFVVSEFFDDAVCAKLRAQPQSARHSPATITNSNGTFVDERVRRTTCLDVPVATTEFVDSHLRTLQPRLESHFSRRLKGCQTPRFLVYGPGDFYQPHFDGSSDASVA